MYTLDRLGYSGTYDVYDHMGYGSANNDLGGRATVAQASHYALIVHDDGQGGSLPDGTDLRSGKVDQSGWYREWLSSAVGSGMGAATLWVIAGDMAEARGTDPLIFSYMGADFHSNVVIDLNPDVAGQASFTFENGNSVDFASDWFTLNAGCPWIRELEGLEASGGALVTHRYRKGSTVAGGSTVMNRNTAEQWNTILMSFPWYDIVDPSGSPSASPPENQLMARILNGVLPVDCIQSPDPTDTQGSEPGLQDVLKQTALHQNVPNPFNPTTTIRFDLVREAHVRLHIHDVAGRLVRTLVDKDMSAGRNHSLVWDGLDDAGVPVSSGIYFYRLEAGDFSDSRKMVVLR
jgi:hypothetical protein